MYKMLRIICISLDVTEPNSIIECASSIIFCKKITFSKKIIIHVIGCSVQFENVPTICH